MPVNIYPGLVPIGNGSYLIPNDMRGFYPWDGEEEIEETYAVHTPSAGKTVIVFRDGSKAIVDLVPDTVVERYLKATQGEVKPV